MLQQGKGVRSEIFLHECGDLRLRMEDRIITPDTALFIDQDDAEIMLMGVERIQAFLWRDRNGGREQQLFVHVVPDFLTLPGEEPPGIGGFETKTIGIGAEEVSGIMFRKNGKANKMEIRALPMALEEFLHLADHRSTPVRADGVDVSADHDLAAQFR